MFDFKVMPDNSEAYEVTAKSRDVRSWEAMHRDNSLRRLSENPTFVDYTKIAYLASVRQGKYSGTLADFEANCDIDLLEEDNDDAAPFEKAA